MNIKIDYLKYHPEILDQLVNIRQEGLGKWFPEFSSDDIKNRYQKHLNDMTLPLTLVAFNREIPVGMCSLRENDGIKPDLKPWLASLVVSKNYQRRGIGKMLIEAIKEKAKTMKFQELYLFAVDPTIPSYYEKIGFKKIGTDQYKEMPVIVMKTDLRETN